jgi:hypothetical protein
MKTQEQKNTPAPKSFRFGTGQARTKKQNCFNVLMFSCFNEQSGFAALLTIVIVAAATLLMAYNASLLGLGELDLGYTSQKGNEAFGIAEGCLEESLRHFRLDTSYTGENLATSNGSCIIEVTSSGSNATTTVTATTTNIYSKKLEAAFSFTSDTRPVITILSWEEKTD